MVQTACAFTDHGVMYGVVDFYRACKAEGIKPIIGCEVYVTPQGRSRLGISPARQADRAMRPSWCSRSSCMSMRGLM